ncbi:mitochondrial carrier domain-containing protein [Aspergillus egyptiacus]|nr:mitochondrial carrier domain-containing protein [Aspergillus egyptiacus]
MENSALDLWISGAFAVVIVDFLVYPIDTLKTRIQSPTYNTVYKSPATGTINKSLLFRGLYQGVFSVVLSTIPASGAFFTTYESVKSGLNGTKSFHCLPNPVINALSSSTGEMVSCFLLTPAEVIKQNAQVVNKDNSSPSPSPNSPATSASASSSLSSSSSGSHGHEKNARGRNVTLQVLSRFKSHPWKLWSGYSALLGRNLPFTGLNFPIFEGVKGYLVRRRREQKASGGGGKKGKDADAEPVFERAVLTGIAASISGGIASVVTTPIDVVKTRMMLAASEGGDAAQGVKGQRNIWSVGRQVFQDEGVKGLFRGGAIRVVWTAVALSIYLGIYEGGRFYLEKRRKSREMEGV